MRSVSAFGEIVDAAAAGERFVVERAGQPLCAIVPLSDLALVDPDRRKTARLAAIDDIARYARRHPFPKDFDAVRAVREGRDERDRKALQGLK
jgi:antitoxin (DNA-binding transcriptional repressor) of toxin-antitoxin stability system